MGGAAARPSDAVLWRGHWFDPQTAAMLQELADTSGSIYVRPIQGCWSDVAASGDTHTRACVVDVDCEQLTDAEAVWLETKWRSMGGGGWFRPRTSPSGYVYGWQRHAHLFHPDGDMADTLADQWQDYLSNRNGLANNGQDTGTRAYVGMTWARYRKEHNTVTPEQLATILARIDAVPQRVWRFPLVNRITRKSWSAGSYLEGGNLAATQGAATSTRAAAQVVALQATVAELAKAQGLSDQELLATIGQRVDAALDGLRLSITVAATEDQEVPS